MKLIKDLYIKYKEIICYLFWGVMTTVVSWSSYSLAALMLKNAISSVELLVAVSNLISWIMAVSFAFVSNKLWVFNSKSWVCAVVFSEMCKFLSARIFTGIMEIVLVPFLVSIGLDFVFFGIDGIVSKMLVSIFVVVANYAFSKLVVFKSRN